MAGFQPEGHRVFYGSEEAPLENGQTVRLWQYLPSEPSTGGRHSSRVADSGGNSGRNYRRKELALSCGRNPGRYGGRKLADDPRDGGLSEGLRERGYL